MAPNYVWPLSNSTTPDEMNTSFGPRVNRDRWDFHDGIDFPGERGVTAVHALRDGVVRRVGPKDDRFSSRHVVVEVDDPIDGPVFLVYLHLASTDPALAPGVGVTQGEVLGLLGDDGAEYPHLHLEFRKGSSREIASTHPLGYLPYPDTSNFSPPVADRFNCLGPLMAARLLFGAPSRLEGDLKRVEVELRHHSTLLEFRFVDLDNKRSVNEGNADERLFLGDIGVEGYQKSPMNDPQRRRDDLRYGVVVRNLPSECDTLVARVIDVRGHVSTSAPIAVPDQTAFDEVADFEDGAMPPAGWRQATSTGTTVTNQASAAHTGSRGLLCVDPSTTEDTSQRAGIELDLAPGRFEWVAEGRFNPLSLGLAPDQSVQLLRFQSGQNLVVAARILHRDGRNLARILAREADGTPQRSTHGVEIGPGWRRWRLHVLRLGTRETTAVLYLDEGGQLVEQDRLDFDSTGAEPEVLRAGIAFSSAGATATVAVDDLRVTDSTLP